MKKSIKISFLFLSAIAVGLMAYNMQLVGNGAKVSHLTGEQLRYDVYFKGVKVGKSVLTFHDETVYEGKDVYHISLDTTLPFPAFSDKEDIYAEKDTFLPLKVSRRIRRTRLLPETIEEIYDQENFSITITKKGRLLSRRSTVKKKGPIHNAIALPYYYRFQPDITQKKILKISLPTADFEVAFKGKENVTTALGIQPAYVFASVPEKFRFYLSADEKRIPLKIESLTALNYSFVLSSAESK